MKSDVPAINSTKPLRTHDEFLEQIDEAFDQATQSAIAEHHRAGRAVPIMQPGEDHIVFLHPDGRILADR